MAIGGMYHILQMIAKSFEEDQIFEKKDIEKICGLCMQSVTNNLTRLCKAGFLEKKEIWEFKGQNKTRRIVRYRLTPMAKKFLNDIIGEQL